MPGDPFVRPDWVLVAGVALGTGLAGFLGVWLMYHHEAWARRHTGELITFASGVLVGGSLLHILPRAAALIGPTPALQWALAAFVSLYVAENHFIPHPHVRTEVDGAGSPPAAGHGHGGEGDIHPGRSHRAGLTAVVGLGLHSVFDGVAMGAGFSTSLITGAVIMSLVVSHKLPVGIASMGALYHGGHERRRALRLSGVVILTSPVAFLVSYLFLNGAGAGLLGALVAAAGGSFLYVGAADLLPEGQAAGRKRNTALFLLGVGIMLAVLLLRLEGG